MVLRKAEKAFTALVCARNHRKRRVRHLDMHPSIKPMAESTDEEVKDDQVENDDKADDVEEEKKSDDKDEDVVPVRKSVLNAQRRIIEKQGKKLAESENEDEELTPNARKLIQDAVDKAVAPLNDEIAFRDYFSEHPEDKKPDTKPHPRFDPKKKKKWYDGLFD